MKKEEWKKNDALMKRALAKMHLFFFRNPKTWEAEVFTNRNKRYEVTGYNEDDFLVPEGPNDPESLGHIVYFMRNGNSHTTSKFMYVDNIFFGVKSAEELSIKLDLIE